MSDVSVRRVETPVYDGSSGQQVDTHVNYELGAEIDGTFIPFATVREAFVKHSQDIAARQAEKDAAAQQASAPPPGTNPTGEPTTTGEAAQNLGQPGSETSA